MSAPLATVGVSEYETSVFCPRKANLGQYTFLRYDRCMTRFESSSAREEANNLGASLAVLLDESDLQEDFRNAAGAEYKGRLKRIAKHLPEIGTLLLRRLRDLVQCEGLDPGILTLFLVGGRVRQTPISDNTDFDIVISADSKLTPFGKHATIAFDQRRILGQALYEEIERIFIRLGLHKDYEKGILEIKGLGERTALEVQKEEAVLKIAEDKE